jgi:hypothetical protein
MRKTDTVELQCSLCHHENETLGQCIVREPGLSAALTLCLPCITKLQSKRRTSVVLVGWALTVA